MASRAAEGEWIDHRISAKSAEPHFMNNALVKISFFVGGIHWLRSLKARATRFVEEMRSNSSEMGMEGIALPQFEGDS